MGNKAELIIEIHLIRFQKLEFLTVRIMFVSKWLTVHSILSILLSFQAFILRQPELYYFSQYEKDLLRHLVPCWECPMSFKPFLVQVCRPPVILPLCSSFLRSRGMPHIYVDCDIGLESAWVYQLTLVMGCFVIQINESFPYIERNNL